jgi:RNA polymerase sigma factor (sigma-70 family)
MEDRNSLQPKQFEALLKLFSDNREEAGKFYEALRRRLVRFFLSKKCDHAEQLADETLNRVALKASTFDPARNIRPATFVFGFASKVHLEYLRRPDRSSVPIGESDIERTEAPNAAERPDEIHLDCLDACLLKLSPEDRELVIKYYSRERAERIEMRRQLAEFLGVSQDVLHVRVFRIRKTLRKCVDSCIAKKTR